MSNEIKLPKYTSRADIAEMFADGVKNVHFTNGVMHAELTVTRVQEQMPAVPPLPPILETITSGRIVLTPNAVIQVCTAFQALLAAVQQHAVAQGMVTPPTPAPLTPAKH